MSIIWHIKSFNLPQCPAMADLKLSTFEGLDHTDAEVSDSESNEGDGVVEVDAGKTRVMTRTTLLTILTTILTTIVSTVTSSMGKSYLTTGPHLNLYLYLYLYHYLT